MLNAIDLRCERLVDPMGIGDAAPELSWRLAGEGENLVQEGFQIRAAATAAALDAGPLLWDPGMTEDGTSCGCLYGGPALRARDQVWWQVRVQDGSGAVSPWSRPACFEVGLPSEADWRKSQWFGFPGGWSGHAVYFQAKFRVDRPVKKGRIYFSGLGWSEAWFNGASLNNGNVLDPGQTDYSRSWHYRTYDVTSLLRVGENVFTGWVGAGFHGTPRFRYVVEGDGEMLTRTHVTSMPFMWPSPVVRNSVYGGEEYDARLELPSDWLLPGGSDLPVRRAGMRLPPLGGVPRGVEEEPVRRVKEYSVVRWDRLSCGRYVADFGQNFAGWCRWKGKAPAGTRIAFRFAEMRNSDGSVNQQNLLADYAEDVYTASGNPSGESFEPRFTYHGFRFVEVSGLPEPPGPDTLTGVAIRSDCRPNGEFHCSNELWNRIWKLVRDTESANLMAVPTDCPQRTERMGWLNDVMARCEGALYLFDESALLTKWLRDILQAQDPETGEVPMTAPFYWGFDVDPVCSSFVEAAWLLHVFCGRTSLLRELYPGIKKWIDCMIGACDADGILRKGGFVGDWCPPLAYNNGVESAQNHTVPHEVISTAVMFYAAELTQRIARVLGEQADAASYEEKTEKIRQDFLRTYRTAPGRFAPESQSIYCYAVYYGILPAAERQSAADRLAELFRSNKCKHSTGNIGTKYLLEVLSQYGHVDLAARLISSRDYPGWGYMLENGATTLWERWEKAEGEGMNSHDHPMLGCPCGWFYRYPAGIRADHGSRGFRHFVLDPVFFAELEFAGADFDSCAGLIRSHWRREGDAVVYEFTIPPNASAQVRMPDGSAQEFGSGSYRLEYPSNC